MAEPIQDPEIVVLEAALVGLKPLAGSLDRDRLMYRAGQFSVPKRAWLWQGTTGFMTAVALALGIAVVSLIRQESLVVERVIIVSVKEPAPLAPPKNNLPAASMPVVQPAPVVEENPSQSGDLLRLRDQMLVWGVDVLPNPPPATVALPSISPRELLDFPPEFLDKINALRLKNSIPHGDRS